MLASWSRVQDRGLANLRAAAFYHAGHVLTPGLSYQLVDPRYYAERVQLLRNMPPVDAGQFVVKAMWSYFVAAAGVEDRVAAGAGVPAGAVRLVSDDAAAAVRRAGRLADATSLLTSMLVAHATAAIADRRLDQRQHRHADPASGAGVAVPGLAVGVGRAGMRARPGGPLSCSRAEGAVLMAIVDERGRCSVA